MGGVSRIRQIKPSWFLDKELRRGTSADEREFYIGLWMLADDEGYLEWDEERIAAELYPYDSFRKRERNVARWADTLERLNADAPHLVVYTCGHARVPKMKAHQRIAGKQATGVRRKHDEECRGWVSRLRLSVATDEGEPNSATDSPGMELGRERNGTSRNGRVAGAISEFQDRVPRDAALGRPA